MVPAGGKAPEGWTYSKTLRACGSHRPARQRLGVRPALRRFRHGNGALLLGSWSQYASNFGGRSFPSALLQRRDLAQAPLMAGSFGKLCLEKGLHQIPRQFRPFNAAAQANQIEIIIFDALSGGKIVFD